MLSSAKNNTLKEDVRIISELLNISSFQFFLLPLRVRWTAVCLLIIVEITSSTTFIKVFDCLFLESFKKNLLVILYYRCFLYIIIYYYRVCVNAT